MKNAAPSRAAARRSGQLRLLIGLLLLCAGLIVAVYNRQGLSDYVTLRAYTAPTAVAGIADRDTLTSKARRIFYVNKPDIAAKASFAGECPSGNEQTVVLGCYHGDQSGIYVLQVSDNRLSGIEEVTAAHEMLHAAYDRLNSRQKHQVDEQLIAYFNHGLTDETVRQQINSYKKSEPDALVNEMHSILGTEVANLPAPLERYYRQYFSDRSAVVNQYGRYESEFTSRQVTIKADDTQLASLKSLITTAEASLSDQATTLQAREQTLNGLRASGDTAGYNAQVPGYNAQVDSYNRQVATTRQQVDQYNQLVAARNAIVLETQQLTNEITSNVTPIN